eukprot:TRINITY_DN122778_c0_g1_i1.p1 TRINITY_DN122778_c0_g1~~TRINITY_DN122778_c0_g1_i1.p1  ORF type:complete len:672 (+),score=167.17 TRINITY_DN122778_c0_g1_i1:122-2137(+)
MFCEDTWGTQDSGSPKARGSGVHALKGQKALVAEEIMDAAMLGPILQELVRLNSKLNRVMDSQKRMESAMQFSNVHVIEKPVGMNGTYNGFTNIYSPRSSPVTPRPAVVEDANPILATPLSDAAEDPSAGNGQTEVQARDNSGPNNNQEELLQAAAGEPKTLGSGDGSKQKELSGDIVPSPAAPTNRPSTISTAVMQKSKSSFNAVRTEREDKDELAYMFELAEKQEAKLAAKGNFRSRLASLDRSEQEFIIDSVIGIVIFANCIFIGFSMDASSQKEKDIALALDVVFSICFISELSIKMYVNGFVGQYCGENARMNIFDASLIFIDLVQLTIIFCFPDMADVVNELPSASLFRVVRLVRIARMMRLLRHKSFESLLMMMHGLAGGISTLVWAMILFFMVLYFTALVFREFLGRERKEEVFDSFNSVPRSMLTVFRCSFGDCSSIVGNPLVESVDAQYSWVYTILLCIFLFCMTVGLFNVISAIFVESTMSAAMRNQMKQKHARLQDEVLFATRIHKLVQKLCEYSGHFDVECSHNVDAIYDMEIDCDVVAKVGMNEEAKAALEDLDIDAEDHEKLAEILDPDQGGSIAVIELVEGIRRLRGEPKRSDIVTIDLMLRSIQRTVQDIRSSVKPDTEKKSSKKAKSQEDSPIFSRAGSAARRTRRSAAGTPQ